MFCDNLSIEIDEGFLRIYQMRQVETVGVQFTGLGQRTEDQPKLSYGRGPSVVGDGSKLSFVVSDSGEGILPRNRMVRSHRPI